MPMPFADHFSTIAAKYAAYRPTYPPALVEALGSGGVAWDVGCGNGQLSIGLAAKFDHVIATDPAQAQLDAAPKHPRVEYRCVSAEESGLPDRSVDLIVCAQAAHWFDWPKFVAEAGRIAKPGALVALVSYGNMVIEGTVGEIIEHYHHGVVGKYWPKGREHVENGYRDLVMPWTPVAAPAIDMRAEWTRDELVGYVSSWSATVKCVDVEGPAPFEKLQADLAAAWPNNEKRLMRWPLTLRLARV